MIVKEMDKMRDPFNYNWIEDGELLAGSMPTNYTDIEQLSIVRDIRVIVSLTRRRLVDCDELLFALSDRSMWYFHYPLSDGDKIENNIALQAVDRIDKELRLGLPVFVHCRAGIGRTGTILIAYYILKEHLTLEAAYAKARLRKSTVSGRMADDLSAAQHEWLKTLV